MWSCTLRVQQSMPMYPGPAKYDVGREYSPLPLSSPPFFLLLPFSFLFYGKLPEPGIEYTCGQICANVPIILPNAMLEERIFLSPSPSFLLLGNCQNENQSSTYMWNCTLRECSKSMPTYHLIDAGKPYDSLSLLLSFASLLLSIFMNSCILYNTYTWNCSHRVQQKIYANVPFDPAKNNVRKSSYNSLLSPLLSPLSVCSPVILVFQQI